MNFDILFYVLYFIILLIFSTLFILQSVFYSQSNSYTYQSIFLELWKFLTNKIGLFIMLIVVGVLSFVVFSYNRFIIIPILIFEFAIMLLMIDYSIVFNVKFTSRVVRLLICCSVVEMLVCCLLYRYVPIVYLGNLFSMIVIVLFILYLFSFTIMWPIEKIIGCYYLNKCKTKLSRNVNTIKIGITGSFGKTSTKEILASILSTQYNVLSTPKSYNTPFGISKTVNSSLSYQHEMFIVEMGAKKKGEIDYLCKLVNVDCGIVTSVGRQHTNTFKGIDGVYNTKKELPDYLSGRLCVFNLNNSLVRKMYGSYIGNGVGVFYLTKRRISVIKCVIKRSSYFKCFKLTKIVFFEFSKLGNFYAKNIDLSSSGSNFDLWFDGEFLGKMRCRLIGIHNITNCLLAIAMAYKLGVAIDNIKIGLSSVDKIESRLDRFISSNGAMVINNGYNSNIDSARFSLSVLKLYNDKKCVVVTPGLIETENNWDYNYNFGRMLSEYADEVIIVKYCNRDAILSGLKDVGYELNNVRFVETFENAREIINSADTGYVFLIENDLPDNYK